MKFRAEIPARVFSEARYTSPQTGRIVQPGEEIEGDEDWCEEFGAASVWVKLSDGSGYVWRPALVEVKERERNG